MTDKWILFFLIFTAVTFKHSIIFFNSQIFSISYYLQRNVGIILVPLECTSGPDVNISTGVSCDGVPVISKRDTQHILWLLVFLQKKGRDKPTDGGTEFRNHCIAAALDYMCFRCTS